MFPWCSLVFVILLQAVYVENKGSPQWPYGKYTLLKPRTGCPDGWDDKGYLYQDTIEENPSNNRSEILHIDGEVSLTHVERYFCSKTEPKGREGTRDFIWQSGQYCVYTNREDPLFGMEAGSIVMYDRGNDNADKSTFTKIFEFLFRTYKGTKLYFSCKTTGNKKRPISLPITKPFYLLPYGSRDCQQVKRMVATSEWIRYHTDNYKDRLEKEGAVPYHELGDINHKGITMFYCYYKSCKFTLTNMTGVFQSPGFPGKYPDGQLCSWRIMVPDNHTLRVHFTNFSLSANDTLKYSKKINGSFRSKYKIPDSMERPFTLSSNSNVLFVFRSDESNNITGFRAEYRVFITKATTPPKASTISISTSRAKTAPTEAPTTAPNTTTSTTSIAPLSKRKPSTRKPLSSTLSKDTKSTQTSTSQPASHYNKSNAETMKDSLLSSRNKATIVIVVPSVCLLIGVVLLIMIIYQCRARRARSRVRNSKRDTEGADRSVMNPTYERGAMLLNSPNETAMTNIALNGGDDSRMFQNDSCVTPEYEDVECEKSNKVNPNRSRENSEAKKAESVNDSDNGPLYHVSELHDPKRPSHLEPGESDVVKDSGPNPLYHFLEGPVEDQFSSRSMEKEVVKDSGPNPLYHVLGGPDPNNEPDVEDQSNSRSRKADVVKDSGSNHLYHVLGGPDPDVALAEDQTYEDVD